MFRTHRRPTGFFTTPRLEHLEDRLTPSGSPLLGGGGGEQPLFQGAAARIQINGPGNGDNMALFDPPLPYRKGSGLTQTIPATITNLGSSRETFQLSVVRAGTGNVKLSVDSVDLKPGAFATIAITPTADSSKPNDVRIFAGAAGVVVEDDMTVVEVYIANDVFAFDTPFPMQEAHQDRIPPKVKTFEHIGIDPDLSTSDQSVTLVAVGSGGNNGTFTIDGKQQEEFKHTTRFNLIGGEQTAPGSAGHLHLVLQMGGSPIIQSRGFSVAAIPVNWNIAFDGLVTAGSGASGTVGIRMINSWKSDSGDPLDLSEVQIKTLIVYVHGDGPLTTLPLPQVITYPDATTGGRFPDSVSTETVSVQDIRGWIALTHEKTGSRLAQQVSFFSDKRTGGDLSYVDTSEYSIEDQVKVGLGLGFQPALILTTTVKGAFALGVSVFPGQTSPSPISVPQTLYLLNPLGDPLVVTTQPPGTVTAGSPFGLTVTAQNADGTTNTSFTGLVTLFGNGGGLRGTLAVNAVNGVATFAGLELNQAGSWSLSASSPLLPTVSSSTISVTAAPAVRLVPQAPFGPVPSGTPFSVAVDALDPFGNTDTNFNGPVTLALANNPTGGTLGGTLTVHAVSGVASFSGLTVGKPGGFYTLQATSSGLTSGTTAPFAITDQLVVTSQPPASVAAGTPFGLVVAVEDGNGNVDPSFNGVVTIADFFGVLGGTPSVNAVHGVATFTGLTINQSGTTSISLTSEGLNQTATNSFLVTAGPAVQLAVHSPYQVLTGAPFPVTVNALDAQGNVDTNFSGSMTLSLANSPGGASLGGTLTVNAVKGVATFTGLTLSKPASGYTLQATSSSLIGATSTPFDVVDQLVVTTFGSIVTAGSPFGLAVSAEDGAGNVIASFNGFVRVADSTGTVAGTLTVQAVNGVATFTGLTTGYASSHSLYLTSPGLVSTRTASFNVHPVAASQLVVASPYGTVLRNQPFSLVVQAEDPFGNLDPSFSGSVTIALHDNPAGGSLLGTLSVKAFDGVAVFSNLQIDTADAGCTIQATSSGLSSGTSAAFGVLDPLVVTTQPPASVSAGSAFGLVVAAEDGAGNPLTSFNGSVTVSGALSAPVTVNAVNGVATFTGLKATQAGFGSLSVSSAGLAPATTSYFSVTPAPANQLVVSAPYSVLPRARFSLTVGAEDSYGNVDTSFNGPVTLALGNNPGGATLGGTLTVYASNGTANFSGLTIDRPGSGFTLQASSSGPGTGTSLSFDVSNQLVVTSPPPGSVTAGSSFGLAVAVEDGLGNVDTSFNGPVTVDEISASPTVNAVNGLATFSGLTFYVAGTGAGFLSISSNGLAGTYLSITVTPAAASKLVVTAPSGTVLTGTAFGVSVSVEDPYRNVATDFNGPVTLSLANNPTGATLGGTTTVLASRGVVTFSEVTISQQGSGYTLQASAAGLSSGKSQAFDVSNDQLVVTTQPPASVTAGSPFGLVVQAKNGQGAVDTSFSGAVTLSDEFPFGTSNLGGTVTVNAVNGVATFTGLTIDQAGPYSVSAGSSGLAEVTSNDVIVTAAPATQLVLSPRYGNVLTGTPFALTLTAQDPFGNNDQTYSGSVTLALGNNPTGASLGGTLTVQASFGVATFSGVTISQPGSGYTIQASAAGLSGATTPAIDVTNDQLVVTTPPPASITAGSVFGLVVSAENGSGAVDTSFSGSVTLADLYGNPLSGTLSVNAVNGVATFSGLTLTVAGGDALTVSSPGVAPPAVTYVDVQAAPATHLVLSPLYGNVLTGKPFGLTLSAEDPFGNIANFNGSVTLSLASNPTGTTLGGTTTVQASFDFVNFYGLTIGTPGSGYTLQASTAGLSSVTTPAFDVTNDQLVDTAGPYPVPAGTAFGLSVTALDASGKTDSSFGGSVTLSLIDNDGSGGSLSGTLTVTAVGGVATFTGLTIDRAGSYALAIGGPGVGGTITSSFDATASQLAVTVQAPPLVNAGAAFSVAITAEDSQGNIDLNFSGSVTLALGSNPAGGTLGGTLTVSAVNGVATFTDLTIDQPGSGYTIQASNPGLDAATSAAIDVVPAGTATQLVLATQPPETVAAGSPFGLVVQAEDSSGNVTTGFSGSVTLALFDFTSGTANLGGTVTMNAVNGVATFTDLSIAQPGLCALSADSSGLPGTATDLFSVTAGAATQLAVAGPTGNVLTGSPFALEVDAVDPSGNIDPTYNGGVTISLGNNPITATLGGTLTVQATNGVANFSGLTIGTPGSGYTLQASASGLGSGTSPAFDVSNDRLVVTTQPPASVTAGSGFGLAVQAENGQGAIDTSFSGSVTLAEQFGSTLSGTLTVHAVNGVATFFGLTLTAAGSDALTVSSPGVAPATTTFFEVTATPTQLVLTSPPPGLVTAGAPFGVDVAVEDRFGNIDTGYSGSVTLALAANPGTATLGGTLTVTAVNGVASFSGLTISKPASSCTLQASSSGLSAATSSSIEVSAPGVATQLVVTTQPADTVAAGSAFGLVVQAEDSFGNVVTTFSGVVSVTDPADGSVLGQMAAVQGVATFTGLTLSVAGDYLLPLSSTGLPGATTGVFAVTTNAASRLTLFMPSGHVLPGRPFDFQVQAVDGQGNIDPNFNGPVTLAPGNNPTGATLGGTLTVNAVNGVADFPGLTLDEVGSGYTLQASSAGLASGTSFPFDVTSDLLVVTTQPPGSIAAGSGIGLVVQAQDSSGAVDTSFTGSVSVSLIALDGNSAKLGGTLTVHAVNGVATFSGLAIDQPGSDALGLSGTGVGSTASTPFLVTLVPTQLVVTGQPPSSVKAGTAFTAAFAVEDAHGDVASTFSGSVSLALAGNPTGATLGGTLTVSAVNGVATFSGLTISQPGLGYTLQATSTGLSAATTSAFAVTREQLVVTAPPPASITAGSGFGLVVKAEDGNGNLDTSFNGSVSVALASPGSATLGGTRTVQAVNGVAIFAGLSIDQPGSYRLALSSSGAASASTGTITVTAVQGITALSLSNTSVLEFRPLESRVGSFSSTENGNGHTFSYSLVAGTGAADNGSFTISGSQLLSADAFDLAAKASYSIRVRSSDERGNTFEQTFTITVVADPALTRSGSTLTVKGTSRNDTFAFTPGSVRDSLTLNGVQLAADVATVKTVVFQGGGGSDSATLSTGSGSNTLTLTPTGGTLTGTGYTIRLVGVGHVTVHGGARDRAFLSDTTGNDTFTGGPTSSTLSGKGYADTAAGFAQVSVTFTRGKDRAALSDGKGNDKFVGSKSKGTLSGPGFSILLAGLTNVDLVTLSGTGGKKTLQLAQLVYHLQRSGVWSHT